jgi:pimeloyl-ACP methyl ester carboxylesterase
MPRAGRISYTESVPPGNQKPQGTLVLIHAFPLHARMWEPQLALAGGGWRIIAPDLRGLGDTAGAPAASMDDFAADVVDLLDALRIEQAVIGGLSMGGYVAFALFRLAPRYFRGMVLADTRAEADTPEGIEGRKKMLKTVEEKGVAAVADEMLGKLLGETTRREHPEVVETVRSLIAKNTPGGVAGAIRALMSRSAATDLLSSIHCPTLVLVGEEDVITPPALSRELHRAIAGSALVEVPGAGHLSSLEQPAAFNRALSAFLAHRV